MEQEKIENVFAPSKPLPDMSSIGEELAELEHVDEEYDDDEEYEDAEEEEVEFDPKLIPVNHTLDTEFNKNLSIRSGLTRCNHPHRPDFDKIIIDDGLTYNMDDAGNPYWGEGIYYQITEPLMKNIKEATQELHNLCLKALDSIVAKDEYLTALRIPVKFWPLLRKSWNRRDPHLYGRFDLGLSQDINIPPKLFEYNADTPTALLESSDIQERWMKDVIGPNARQFNELKENLIIRWKEMKGLLLKKIGGWFRWNVKVQFTGVPDPEDLATINVLKSTAETAGLQTEFLAIEDLGWNDHYFVDLNEQKIEVLFKLYPWEWLVIEEFSDYLLEDTTILIEPIWKMILSNKAVLPILWELFPNHPNLLPAYFTEEEAKMNLSEHGYVKKPIFGREGANVTIVTDGKEEYTSEGEYGEEGFIYQGFVQVPKFETEKGNWSVVVGSWVIGDKPSGICLRESNTAVTTNTSVFCCHVIKSQAPSESENKTNEHLPV
jgi:glutathionylspermidine synthase